MKPLKRLLFVCIENSNRSQMAEAFARIHGGVTVESYSSGSKPSGIVNPRAIQFMTEKGYDLTAHSSKSLDEIPKVTYDAAITMGCGDECPFVQATLREDWAIPCPKHVSDDEFRTIRDGIEAKVLDLLKRLKT